MGEYLEGVTAVAAAIRGEDFPLSAIWSVAFSSSLSEEKQSRLIPGVQATARSIERALREKNV